MRARIRHDFRTCYGCEKTVREAIVLTIGATPVTVCPRCWELTVRAVERAKRKDEAMHTSS